MSESPSNRQHYITRPQLILLAAATGATVANAYYVHPFISDVALTFRLSDADVGSIPALNQLALALGILLLLPLGDRMNNKRLATICVVAQTVCLIVMAYSGEFVHFLTASTVLGFFTIVPYLLPAFVSKHVAPDRQGEVTAILTVGVIASILLARAGGGIVAEYFGWRTVYWIAVIIMLAASSALPFIMPNDLESHQNEGQSYWRLQLSLFGLLRQHPDVLMSGFIQGLNFGSFIALWLGIGLYLPSPEIGYGTDVVGYLTFLALVNLVTTFRLGRWADSIGARRARLIIASIRIVGAAMLFLFNDSIWWLIPPVLILGVFGPVVDVTGRMTIFEKSADKRTRLMSIYIVLMFLGGAFGSSVGTLMYDWASWTGVAWLCFGMAVLLWVLAAISFRLERV